MNLRALGEDRLLARLLPNLGRNSSVVIGAGDDCAVVETLGEEKFHVLKTDCVVEGIHFTRSAAPDSIGWKAMARPLSDFAAMSAVPRFALVTMILPSGKTLDWVKKLYRGLTKGADRFGVAIVGGETSNIKGPAVISVSVTGFVEKNRCITRSGGKVNDDLFVTGRLGGAIRGRHLEFIPRIEESRWLTKNFPIHAMMDLSDGLGADLPRLARASGLGFAVDENSLPRNRGCTIRQAIGDGEDYELLFAVSPKIGADLERRWKKHWPLKLTRIGRLTRPSSGRTLLQAGYVHFK